jgi:redox-sensitive bicupin YhaK (pirin superfamily)
VRGQARRFAIVVQGNHSKFSQNPALGHFLLSTGTAVLVEASPRVCNARPTRATLPRMTQDPVLSVTTEGFPWRTSDPFLFCVYHDDKYPAGDAQMGPAASLAGRQLGQDFAGKDGWRMYHGERVPGFPAHPHRGFETVTIVRQGVIDHADSLGATARFGAGDTQWLTAGSGIVHAEMFPLLSREQGNPLELFQLWLNLPSHSKLVPPYFSMFWREQQPRLSLRDAAGRSIVIDVIAGALPGALPLAPPPDSWAARPEAQLAIWTLRLAPGASWTLPASAPGLGRSLYLFKGESLDVHGHAARPSARIQLRSESEASLVNGPVESQLLLLQGRPIGEPVAQDGPFVMNTRGEVMQAYADYRRTRFGGWPWPDAQPVHAREETRFARFPDGRVERPHEPNEAEQT